MEHLLNDDQGYPDKIKNFAGKIRAPTLVLWGEDDQVDYKDS